jgi:hypothetical protein
VGDGSAGDGSLGHVFLEARGPSEDSSVHADSGRLRTEPSLLENGSASDDPRAGCSWLGLARVLAIRFAARGTQRVSRSGALAAPPDGVERNEPSALALFPFEEKISCLREPWLRFLRCSSGRWV